MKNSPNLFDVSLQPPRFAVYSLMVFVFEKFLTDKACLGYDLSIYNNIPKCNQNHLSYNSKNRPGELYTTNVPGF